MKVIDTYKRDEKVTSNFKPSDDSDVTNKIFLDGTLSKIDVHLSVLEKEYNEYKKLSKKHSVEEDLSQRAVKTTTEIIYDKGSIDSFPNADRVLKFFCLLKDVDLI